MAAAIVAALLVGACTTAKSETAVVSHTDTEAIAYVNRVLATHPGEIRRGVDWRVSLRDALPNHRYRAGQRIVTACDLVVLGAVSDVVKLDGFIAESDEELPKRVDFDDTWAMFKTVAIQITVERTLAGRLSHKAQPLSVLVSLDGSIDFGLLRQGLMRQPRSVFLLSRLPYDSGGAARYFIARGGALMANVAADDSLTLPLVPDADEAVRLLAGSPTLKDLVAAARRPFSLEPVPTTGL